MSFITEEDYRGKHFRIGKALNPYLEKKYRNEESVYDKLVKFFGGPSKDEAGKRLDDTLWEAWTEGRK